MKKQAKKVTKNDKKAEVDTLVNFILDKSGSMQMIKSATISGFNEYINTLKKDGNSYSFSLTLFDTVVQIPYSNVSLEKTKDLNDESYAPNGCTALYDAVCTTINSIKEKKGQKVINIIMTDGEENSSKEFTQKEMKKIIEEKTKKGNWTFVYLGANQDSYAKAQDFGISGMNTSNFNATSKGMESAMCMMANNTSNFACSSLGATANFFSVADQNSIETTGSSTMDNKISQHFSDLGKKSWEKRKKDLLS